ncbi:reverse transcriptase domain-containing protein [Tanacetum coccineum]
MSRMEWQRQSAEDFAVRQMMRTQVLEARAQIDTVEDTGANDAMTPESIQAMINQAIQRNSTHTQDDASQSSGGGLRRPVQPAHMESVFYINGCTVDNQVKFATYTLLGAALTWWNGHVRTLSHDTVYAMTWGTLKKKLTDKYCPKGEIKKLEIELWNLRVRGNDVAAYTQRFQELALMCTKFLADETKKGRGMGAGVDGVWGKGGLPIPASGRTGAEYGGGYIQQLGIVVECPRPEEKVRETHNAGSTLCLRAQSGRGLQRPPGRPDRGVLSQRAGRRGVSASARRPIVEGCTCWDTWRRKLNMRVGPDKFLVDETEKVDKYISGLPDNIHGNVMSARPKTLDDAIELANDLMDQKLRTYVERHNDNKRTADDSSRNNQQQQPYKKQNVARAYTAGPGENKAYTGNLPLCTKSIPTTITTRIKRQDHAMNVVTPDTSRRIAQN